MTFDYPEQLTDAQRDPQMHHILKSIFVYVQSSMVSKDSLPLWRNLQVLSLINEFHLESLIHIFNFFFHHRKMKHFKACINLHMGITITFLEAHHKNCFTLLALPLTSQNSRLFFCAYKVLRHYNTLTPSVTTTSAERAHSALYAAIVNHALKKPQTNQTTPPTFTERLHTGKATN